MKHYLKKLLQMLGENCALFRLAFTNDYSFEDFKLYTQLMKERNKKE